MTDSNGALAMADGAEARAAAAAGSQQRKLCGGGTSSGPAAVANLNAGVQCAQRVMQWCVVALVSATGDRRGNVAFDATLPPEGSEISLAERKCS